MTLLCKDICIAKPYLLPTDLIVEKERDNFSLCIFVLWSSIFFFFFLLVRVWLYYANSTFSYSFGIHTCSSVGLVLCFSLYIVFSSFFLLSRKA